MTRDILIIARHPSAKYGYALLGAQAAASALSRHARKSCPVIAFNPVETDVSALITKIKERYVPGRTSIGISGLCYYDTRFFDLIRGLRAEGYYLFLGGPEAGANFRGEPKADEYPHRFSGWRDLFNFAVQGDASAAFAALDRLERIVEPGLDGTYPVLTNAVTSQTEQNLDADQHRIHDKHRTTASGAAGAGNVTLQTDWGNMLRGDAGHELEPFGNIEYAQVLGQIGCPYAARGRRAQMRIPGWLGYGQETIRVTARGCSFCSVATDKGSGARLALDDILTQIERLPERGGKKIYFEYIDEMPFSVLPGMLEGVKKRKLRLEGMRVLTRTDWLLSQKKRIERSLELAEELGCYITMFSIGLESFNDVALAGLCKGTTVETNLRAIEYMRELKKKFPVSWKYSRREIHTNQGLIIPTLWDTPESVRRQLVIIKENGLLEDVYIKRLYNPLEIPHATALADAFRGIEESSELRFTRQGLLIEWANRCPFFNEMTSALDEFNAARGLQRNNEGDTQNQPRYDESGNMLLGYRDA